MALLDGAMATAITGDLGLLATGLSYCRTLSACLDLFNYDRGEWAEARVEAEMGYTETGRSSTSDVRGHWRPNCARSPDGLETRRCVATPATDAVLQIAGLMFWLKRKALSGSYVRLIVTSRSKFRPKDRRTRSSLPSPKPAKFR